MSSALAGRLFATEPPGKPICIHTHIHTHTHTHTHTTHINTHIYTYMYTHTCTHAHTYKYTHIHIHIYIHTHTLRSNWLPWWRLFNYVDISSLVPGSVQHVGEPRPVICPSLGTQSPWTCDVSTPGREWLGETEHRLLSQCTRGSSSSKMPAGVLDLGDCLAELAAA